MKSIRVINGIVFMVMWLALLNMGCKAKIEHIEAAQVEDEPWIGMCMNEIFGNYQPNIRMSALEPDSVSDPHLLLWKLRFPAQTLFTDWDKFTNEVQKEYLQLNDKIPVRVMKHYRFPNDKALLFFEAGGWNMDYSAWGGEGFLYSHPLGVAALEYADGKWSTTGFYLNMGFFGSYRTTKFEEEIIQLGDNEYGAMTEDYDSALFGIRDQKPVVLLRLPHKRSSGHGDPESFRSTVEFIPSGKLYKDVQLKTSGTNMDTDEDLHFTRRWSWNTLKERYELIEFAGNIKRIHEKPNHWCLDDYDKW